MHLHHHKHREGLQDEIDVYIEEYKVTEIISMSDATDQVAALQANNAADATALAALAADLEAAPQSTGDEALAAVVPVLQPQLVAVFGADNLSAALTEAGYTVTAPEAAPAA